MNRRLSLATAAAAAILLTGCGSIGESIAERAMEEGLEAGGAGEDVQIDFDDGDGRISIESSEGSMQIGSTDIPEGFPADIPLPDEATVVSSMSFSNDDGATFNITMTAPQKADSLSEELESGLVDAGYTITGTFAQDLDGDTSRSLQFEGTAYGGNLIVAGTADDTTVNYTVVPTAE